MDATPLGERAAGGPRSSHADDADTVVFRRLYPGLRRFAAVCASPAMEPDDLLQSAVERTLKLHRLSDLENPGGYIRTAIINLARNAARNQAGQPLESGSSARDAYPSDLAELENLSPEERAAVFLVDVEGYRLREAAELLGCSRAATKSRLERGRKSLRQAVGGAR